MDGKMIQLELSVVNMGGGLYKNTGPLMVIIRSESWKREQQKLIWQDEI